MLGHNLHCDDCKASDACERRIHNTARMKGI
jgi:hypothetical protein